MKLGAFKRSSRCRLSLCVKEADFPRPTGFSSSEACDSPKKATEFVPYFVLTGIEARRGRVNVSSAVLLKWQGNIEPFSVTV